MRQLLLHQIAATKNGLLSLLAQADRRRLRTPRHAIPTMPRGAGEGCGEALSHAREPWCVSPASVRGYENHVRGAGAEPDGRPPLHSPLSHPNASHRPPVNRYTAADALDG